MQQTIPNYAIEFFMNQRAGEPNLFTLMNEEFDPPKAKISPQLCTFIIDTFKTFLVVNKEDPEIKKFNAKVRLSFSPREGLKVIFSTDARIKAVFEKCHQDPVSFTLSEAKELQIMDLKRTIPSLEFKQKTMELKGKKLIFLDPVTWNFWQVGIKSPLELKVDVNVIEAQSEGGGLTTSNLRFPHLLYGIVAHLKHKVFSKDLKVCLVGPGLKKGERFCECPQLVELKSIMPEARYLILENDKEALSLMDRAFNKARLIAYNPMMLRARTTQIKNNPGLAAEPVFTILENLKPFLSKQVIMPKHAFEMLQGIGPLQDLMIKLDPSKHELREFDILSTPFLEADKGQFDVVVATMSISIAIDNLKRSPLEIIKKLSKFVELLKTDGILFVDTMLWEILRSTIGEDLSVEYLELLIGSRLKSEILPLSLVDPKIVSLRGCFIEIPKDGKLINQALPTITTFALWSLHRTNEKLEPSPQKLAEITEKLENLQSLSTIK